MDWRFWGPLLVSIATLFVAIWSGLLQQRALAAMSIRNRKQVTVKQLTGPYVAMVVLLVLAWLPYFWLPIYVAQEPLLTGWGTSTGDAVGGTCQGTVNGPRLRSYADKYSVILVCGLSSSRVDRVTDAFATVSPPFTIENRFIPIQSPLGALTMRAIQSVVDPALLASGGPVEAHAPLWYEVAIVPKNTDLSRVQSLADVERVGGQHFPDEYRGAFTTIRVK
jgi:hypothetical protein